MRVTADVRCYVGGLRRPFAMPCGSHAHRDGEGKGWIE